MNIPGRCALEEAVIALLQPHIGYFSDHAVITQTMPIAAWRERMQSAIDAYAAATAAEQNLPHRQADPHEEKTVIDVGEPDKHQRLARDDAFLHPLRCSTKIPEQIADAKSSHV